MFKLQNLINQLVLILLIAASPLLLGCGKAEYDRRLEQRVQQLKAGAVADDESVEDGGSEDKGDEESESSSEDDNPFEGSDSGDEESEDEGV